MLMTFLSHASMRAVCRRILIATVALTVWGGTMSPSNAGILTGSGSHLPHVPLVTTYPVVVPVYTNSGNTTFTGTWSASAAAPWQGTFTGTGPIPSSGTPVGISTYHFTGLAAGGLSAGTFIFFNDLDNGSGSETFSLKAFDSLNAVITTEWLNDTPLGVSGSGSGSGGVPILTDMPGWDWNGISANTYTFDGASVGGNPNILFALENNQLIGHLEFTRTSNFATFGLGAPRAVPEPATVVLLAGCFGASVLRRQWRRRSEAKS